MIDWLTASRYAAALGEHGDWGAAALDEAIGHAPCFQNTPFAVAPLALFADHAAAAALVPSIEAYVALLEKIVGLYRTETEIREWFDLGPAAEELIDADVSLGDAVAVCRLDGYLEQGSEHLYLLENNADSPAGTLFSPRINNVIRDAMERAGTPLPPGSPLTFSAETALLDTLRASARGAGLRSDGLRVAILQFAGRANRESHEMARAFRRAGAHCFVADPREIHVVGGRVKFGAEAADVCWNKVNTVAWRAEIDRDPQLVRSWVTAVSSPSFVNINPFGARYIAESKFALALIREPRFAALFSEHERTLAGSLLPWARRLDKVAVAADGESSLHQHVLDHPGQYVIKEAYDIRGDGVTIGRAESVSDWRDAVAHALENQLIVQRYVPPTAYPIVRVRATPAVVAMPASFDTYVFSGRVAGFGSKASLNPRLNIFQGGQKLAVHVVDKQPLPASS